MRIVIILSVLATLVSVEGASQPYFPIGNFGASFIGGNNGLNSNLNVGSNGITQFDLSSINGVQGEWANRLNSILKGQVTPYSNGGPGTNGFVNLGQGVGSGFNNLGQGVGSGFNNLGQGVGSGFNNLGQGVGGGFNNLGQGVGGGFNNLGQGVGSGFNNLGQGVAVGFNNLGQGVGGAYIGGSLQDRFYG